MPVELIIAPPAAGKTQACIERIQQVRAGQPLAGIRVVVPDSQKAAYFRGRLAASGGGIGVSVGTFRDLYRAVLERCGIFVPVVAPALEHRLVQETISAAFQAGELLHYASIQDKPGFILALQDAFAELRGALVRPSRFLEYTRNAARNRLELAILYNRFLARLQELNWVDMEGQGWLAVDALEGHPTSAADIQLVVVDGFTSFTGVRLHFLKLLADQAGEVLITLPGQLGSNRPVHRRSRDVAEDLIRELSPQVVELTSPPHLPPESLHLQAHVLDPGSYRKMETLSPLLLETRSPSEEAREALRWIKGLHLRSGVPLASCAVYAASLETYQPLLRAAAEEFGMRVHFSYPDSLAESPAVLALLALLGLPGGDYQTRPLFKALRSPYFDFGLAPADVENLEKVSRQAIIVFGREQWLDAWDRLMRSSPSAGEDLDEERRGENLAAGINLPALRSAFAPFWELFNGITSVQSTTTWTAWLEQLLEKLHFYDRITSPRDREACRSLGEALRALVLSESVAGIKNIPYAQFLADLGGALNGARLLEPAASRQDAVLIGRILEARASRFKAVALLGLSEGQFPVVENPDPFLDEDLRSDLGLEPRLDRQQASIFYQAFTRADEHLLLTRPYLSEEGEAWEPSPYWLAAQKLFADQALLRIKPGAARSQEEAASPQELLFWGIQQDSLQYKQDEDLSSRWQGLEKAARILTARRAKTGRSLYEGSLEPLQSELTCPLLSPPRLERLAPGGVQRLPVQILRQQHAEAGAKTAPRIRHQCRPDGQHLPPYPRANLPASRPISRPAGFAGYPGACRRRSLSYCPGYLRFSPLPAMAGRASPVSRNPAPDHPDVGRGQPGLVPAVF